MLQFMSESARLQLCSGSHVMRLVVCLSCACTASRCKGKDPGWGGPVVWVALRGLNSQVAEGGSQARRARPTTCSFFSPAACQSRLQGADEIASHDDF